MSASGPGDDTHLTSAPHTIAAPLAEGDATATPHARATFAGSRSPITVNRRGRFAFTFSATEGLTGRATFASARKIRVSRKGEGRKRVALARKSFTVRAGGKVTLKAPRPRTR